jgi:hypothetical protein
MTSLRTLLGCGRPAKVAGPPPPPAIAPVGADGQHDRELSELEREAIAILEGARRRDGSEAGPDPTPQPPGPLSTTSDSHATALTSRDGHYAPLGCLSAAIDPTTIHLTALQGVSAVEPSPRALSEQGEPRHKGTGVVKRLKRRGLVGALLACAALYTPSLAQSAEAPCPNETLRAENNSASLPDCRAYEQVSPAEKDGGSGGVLPFGSMHQENKRLPFRSVGDGSAITYPGEPFYEVKSKLFEAGEEFEQYSSSRSNGAWSTVTGNTLMPEAVPTPLLPAVAEGTGAKILEETPDGSKVFFLDEKHGPGITPDSNAAEGEPDLYEYTVPSPSHPTGELVDLTVDSNLKAGEPEHGDARGIVGVGGEGAEEGSYVYFVAGGLLSPGAAQGGCLVGEAGGATGEGCNLYLRHDGSTTFVETLPPTDEQGAGGIASVSDWPELPSSREAEVSPNGRYVAYGDEALTGPYAGVPEILRYDAGAAESHETSIVCLSCSPAGAAFAAGAVISKSALEQINGANRQRYVLNDGRVLFTTTATLVPQDINRQADVYEYEPLGVGTCAESTSTGRSVFVPGERGCVSMISAGESEASSSILSDASTNGSNIFFTTGESLAPEDGDEITDVYDAREDGGFPPPPAPACSTEADCRIGTPPLLGGLAATSSSSGTEPPPPPLNLEAKPTTPKPLTRAQKLAKALKQCRKELAGKTKSRSKRRASCERTARSKYGAKKNSKSKKKGSK